MRFDHIREIIDIFTTYEHPNYYISTKEMNENSRGKRNLNFIFLAFIVDDANEFFYLPFVQFLFIDNIL